MWADLTLPWQACIEQAWEAYCAGTTPIGAVVTDGEGNILARGRNRILDAHAPAGQVCQNELAHAELNTIMALGVDQGNRSSWTLYTTTEPCPLCLGAFYMSGMRNLHYASRDPWAGSVNLLGTTPYLSRKPICVTPPGDLLLEAVIVAFFVDWELLVYDERMSVVREGLQEIVPKGVQLGTDLYRSGDLRRMASEAVPTRVVFDRVARLILKIGS